MATKDKDIDKAMGEGMPKVIETGPKAAESPGGNPTPGAEATLEDGSKLVRVPPGSRVVAPNSINGPLVNPDENTRVIGDFKANDPARALADPDSVDPARKIAKHKAETEAKKLREPGALKPGHVLAKVLNPLRLDGQRYEPGSLVQLEETQAEALYLAGVVERDGPQPKPDAGPKPDPGPLDPVTKEPRRF